SKIINNIIINMKNVLSKRFISSNFPMETYMPHKTRTFSRLRRSTLVAAFAAIGMGLSIAPAAHAATDYPNKPVRLIVPYAPGGATDVIGRVVAQHLSTSLGQQFVVERSEERRVGKECRCEWWK